MGLGWPGDKRIIPALAGNTSLLDPPNNSDPDHPRSRGEYSCPHAEMTRRKDHPRSRGEYEAKALASGNPLRIIPALAGNTTTWSGVG